MLSAGKQLCFLAGIAFGAVLFPSVASAAPSPSEAAVEATYLYKFAPFVTWPPTNGNATQPFDICIVGDDPFGQQLDRAVASQGYGPRPFLIVRLDVISRQSTCNMAFIGGSAAQSVDAALQLLRGEPVLTVTDSSDTPGIIDFTAQNSHVRFRIDNDAAQENHLDISSKLLSLAVSVKSSRGSRP